MNNNHLIIMAGGIGSRFWPMSTVDTPKQFLDILGIGKSLLQLTVERFVGICPIENVWIVTSEKYKDLTLEQLPQLSSNQVLLEPCMRNTAPCIAYAAWKIKKKCPVANLVISPADHIVLNTCEFQRVINESLKFTKNSDHIVTLGIKPSRPETGYGYVQRRPEKGDRKRECFDDSIVKNNNEIYPVEAFKEKPDLETAKEYLADGNYFWNAGIFIWEASTVEKVYGQYLPQMADLFDGGDEYWSTDQEQAFINEQFPNCEKISVDYGIMEKAENIHVYPADFGWSDLGTWGSLYDRLPKNQGSNAIVGEQVKMIDSEECIVHVPEGKRVVIQGLKNYIIAESKEILMICDKANEQEIRDFAGLFKD
ncbi:mannose-1-phosphate guanylyltransferase [Puteibacter caeruleilacunae]|nr:mannose-1-phosphate guanylyltransferase [Puteibacter caeruleilacunae]